MIWVLIAAAAVVLVALVLVAVLRSRRRSRADGVATFRRQIDALSPEARRPVVDRVQRLESKGVEQSDDSTA